MLPHPHFSSEMLLLSNVLDDLPPTISVCAPQFSYFCAKQHWPFVTSSSQVLYASANYHQIVARLLNLNQLFLNLVNCWMVWFPLDSNKRWLMVFGLAGRFHTEICRRRDRHVNAHGIWRRLHRNLINTRSWDLSLAPHSRRQNLNVSSQQDLETQNIAVNSHWDLKVAKCQCMVRFGGGQNAVWIHNGFGGGEINAMKSRPQKLSQSYTKDSQAEKIQLLESAQWSEAT